MKVYRVLMERDDGPPKKVPGKVTQALRHEESLYGASSIQAVWDHVAEMMQGPWYELTLLKIEEAAPAIHILRDPPVDAETTLDPPKKAKSKRARHPKGAAR